MSAPSREPLSWLTLELYALNELPSSERARVEAQLAQSSADRACLDSILNDLSELPALPALPATTSARATGEPERDVERSSELVRARMRRERARLGRALPLASMLAVAAALALMFWREPTAVESKRMVYDGSKGGEVALELASDRLGVQPSAFRDGDRLKLLVTCPQWLGGRLHVLVFQGGQRFEPLTSPSSFACGNMVPWPGAFAVDGAAAVDVCITWSADPAKRSAARDAHDLEPDIVCRRLERR